jgi:hypothetical protein
MSWILSPTRLKTSTHSSPKFSGWPADGHPPGDRDRADHRLIELIRLDLGVEVVILAVQGEQAVDLGGVLDDLGEVLELLRGPSGLEPDSWAHSPPEPIATAIAAAQAPVRMRLMRSPSE